MAEPLISIVIPARNREKTLGHCLASVLSQTYSKFEVIVVDDGSTDGTTEAVDKTGDPRVRLVSHPVAKGAQAARNTGIKAAKGDWVAFQDSDDEWLPNKLEKQLHALETLGWDKRLVVHAGMYRYYPAIGKRELWDLPVVEGENAYQTLLRAPGPVFPTFVVAKPILEEIGLLDEQAPSYQEWDTAIRLAKVAKFVQIHEPLAVYWLHGGETISKNTRRDLEGYRYIIEKHRQEILRVAGTTAWHRHLRRLANRCIDFGFIDEANTITDQLPLFSFQRWQAEASLNVAKLMTIRRNCRD